MRALSDGSEGGSLEFVLALARRQWPHAGVSRVSFWTAVVVPVVYPAIWLAGFEEPDRLAATCLLVSLHALALVAGRGYRAQPE